MNNIESRFHANCAGFMRDHLREEPACYVGFVADHNTGEILTAFTSTDLRVVCRYVQVTQRDIRSFYGEVYGKDGKQICRIINGEYSR